MADKDKIFENLPGCAGEYIRLIIKNMGYRRKARIEVAEELADHFNEALKDCPGDDEKDNKARELIEEFGDPKLLAVLIRRAKKRCRPMWQKVLFRITATFGIVALYLLICYARLYVGTPNIKINYAQWLTDQQKQGRDEAFNAKAEIEKASEIIRKYDDVNFLYGNPLWPTDMNDYQKSAVTRFLRDNNEALDIFCKAVNKPYYWVDYNIGVEIITEVNSVLVINPEFIKYCWRDNSSYRTIAKAMVARIGSKVYSEDIDGAIDDTITLFRFAHHIEGKGLLIDQLLAMAIEGLATDTTMKILVNANVSSEQLKRLQDELGKSFASQKQPIDFNGEKAFWYAIIQKGFTDDGRGNGKILSAATLYFIRDWKDAIWSFVAFSYPDRREAASEVDKFFTDVRTKIQALPSQKEDYWTSLSYYSLIFAPIPLKLFYSPFDHIAFMVWRLKTQRDGLLTTLAILRFQKETDHYPEKLDDLVQVGYLTQLPLDPFSGGPLSYKKTEDGFLLYSWGSNLKDDNAQVARNKNGKIRKFAEEGDWIFWPVEKN
jgi:hypothetical protein